MLKTIFECHNLFKELLQTVLVGSRVETGEKIVASVYFFPQRVRKVLSCECAQAYASLTSGSPFICAKLCKAMLLLQKGALVSALAPGNTFRCPFVFIPHQTQFAKTREKR